MMLSFEERHRFAEWLGHEIIRHQEMIDQASKLVIPLPGNQLHRLVVECTALKLVCNKLTGLERSEFTS